MLDASRVVLLVDDEPESLLVTGATLQASGYEVRTARSASEAMSDIRENGLPHLAILDLLMPGTDGLALAQELREFSDLPIMMLSAIDQPETMVRAIEEVAEDYVVKPFLPEVFLARVGRLLRRIGDYGYAQSRETVVDARLSIDIPGRSALVDGGKVSLTPTETKILHILLRCSSRPVAASYLLDRVWPLDEVYEDSLRGHIHRLRCKVEPQPSSPRYLLTERGLGYRFCGERAVS